MSLAIAFETMLTDNFASGVRQRVARRAGLLLSEHAERTTLLRAVESMYAARGQLMHGEDVREPDTLAHSRQAFWCAARFPDSGWR